MNRRNLLKFLATLPLVKTIAKAIAGAKSAEDIALDVICDGYNLGKGTLYFKPEFSDSWMELYKVTEFNITAETERVEHHSSRRGYIVEDLPVITFQKFTFNGTFESNG